MPTQLRVLFLLCLLLPFRPSSAQTVVAGHTAGQFQVSETGAATYTVPITVPPGTAGVEPKLALAYSSQGRNSLLGVGWSLSGLSVISRCPATLAQDGFIDGVDFDAGDRFCLDGERLMAIGRGYGADATEYRTEQDTFRQVFSHGSAGSGPASFTVRTKSGLIMEYGGTEDARIEAEGRTEALFWAVNRIADTKGNAFTVTYEEDIAGGEYRPTRIDYTSNDVAGLSPFASVRFSYEDRPDTTPRYVGGVLLRTGKRLTAVRSYEGEQLYREYRLAYESSETTGRSRLASVTECGSDGTCFAPTAFGWSAEEPVLLHPILHNKMNDGIGGAYDKITGDFNGDGRTDLGLVHFSSTHGWIAYISLSQGGGSLGSYIRTKVMNGFGGAYDKITGDFNGDGRTDLGLVHFSSTHGWIAYVSLSRGNGTFGPHIRTQISAGFGGAYSKITGDFNGDGLTDLGLVHTSATHGWLIKASLSQGDGTFTPILHHKPVQSFGGNFEMLPGDFNGDGRTDVAMIDFRSGGTWTMHVALAEAGGSFPSAVRTDLSLPYTASHVKVPGDFNGDGRADIGVISHSPGADWIVHVTLSHGDGSFAPMRTTTIAPGFQGEQERTIGDFNGDGAVDVAMVHFSATSGWIAHVSLSERDGTFLPYTHSVMSAGFGGVYSKTVGDFNGDGRTDLGLVHLSTTHGWIGKLSLSGADGLTMLQAPAANRIHTITTGHGRATSISYQPLTDDAVYTRDTGAAYPEQDIEGPMVVVASHRISNGVGGERSFSYQYGGAKVHLHGRGFRGFDRTTITDEQTGIATTVFYERDYRCISSKIRRTEQRQPGGALISEVDNTIVIQDHGFGVHFSYIGESVAKQYELDGSLVSTVTTTTDYDDYGNVLTIGVGYDDGQTETTVNTYDDDLDNWFLGRLTRSEVTRTATGHPDQTRISAFTYDPDSGLLTTEVIEPDDAEVKAGDEPVLRSDKAYVHDALGNITASTRTGSDITARTHTTVYYALGRYVEESTNALGHAETKTYVLGNLATLTGPNDLTTSWQYDGFGRQTQELRADGTATDTVYLPCTEDECPDQAVYYVRSDTTGAPSTISYRDVLDREVRQETPGFDGTPVYVDTEYNALGQVARVSEPYFAGDVPVWTVFAYDLVGRTLTETAPGDRITTTEYTGRTTTVTNPLGQTNTRVVDARGQLVSSTDNDGNTVTYDYDAFGNLVTMTDPAGNVTSLTYDIRGNKTSITDPDTGITSFVYNTLGELTSQTDANGNTVTISYDPLGRMTSRTEPEGTSTWTYDTALKGIGKLARVSRGDYGEAYTYDDLGRPAETRITIGGETFTLSIGYDLLGRPETLTYPTGFAVRTLYNAQGYAQEVRRLSDDHVLWQADIINARGQVEQATLGNGLVTTKVFDPETGRVDSIRTGNVQHLAFGYDAIGNLELRSDELRGLSETFVYDGLNRLTSSQVAGQTLVSIAYDALGNITSKSDVGTYAYGENGAGPHAVTSITGPRAATYTYDANGNRTGTSVGVPGAFDGPIFCDGFESADVSAWQGGAGTCGDGSSTVAYTSFNKPHTISEGATTLTFDYGPEYRRYRQVVTTPEGATTKHYVGGLFERETAEGLTRDVHYIRANGQVVAVYTSEDSGIATVSTTRYLHRDHLGSVQTITDETGAVAEVLSFDPWGLRRNAEDWSPATAPIPATLDRGFTGHEHLDEVSLIHMNGRVYDPVIGRFLSADPFVQAPEFSQSLNRYSYVLNNPLSLTDPSGFFFKSIGRFFSKLLRSPVAQIGLTIAGGAIGAHVLGPTFASFLQGGIIGPPTAAIATIGSGAGFGLGSSVAGTALAGGNEGDILRAGLSGAVFGGINAGLTFGVADDIGLGLGHKTTLDNVVEKLIAHGTVQGSLRAAQGGKFEHGFLAGAFGELGIAGGDALGGNTGAAIGGIIAGGTAEALGGGKFANGALSAAFIAEYNSLGTILNIGSKLLTFLRGSGSKIATRGAAAVGAKAIGKKTIDRIVRDSRLLKGKTTRGASLLQKRVADRTITGVKPTQANAERIIRDVLSNPIRSRSTQKFGQMDLIGKSFGQQIGVRINVERVKIIGFRRPDF